MALELPIADITQTLNEALDGFGTACTIDGVATNILISDEMPTNNFLKDASKLCVVKKAIAIQRGSKVIFTEDNKKGIVYTIPNNDMVAWSIRMLICNAVMITYEQVDTYDENTGDLLSSGEIPDSMIDGYVERLNATEKLLDVGLLHEAEIRFTTYDDVSLALEDVVNIKNKKYKIIDVNDMTDGLLVMQLESVTV